MDPNYQRKHDNHPPSYASSSVESNMQGKRQVPFIADNYSSLDEVLAIPELYIYRLHMLCLLKIFCLQCQWRSLYSMCLS